MKKIITCIVCPNGCEIEVEIDNRDIIKIEGAMCKKGKEYVNQELTNPLRNIATSVKVIDGDLEIVSVRLNKNIPKDKIFDVMTEIKKIEVKAPVIIGDILKSNVLNLGADVIATKNIDIIKEKNKPVI